MARILIIEDEDKIRSLFVRIVESSGHRAYSENNGWDGVQAALRIIPDLIICDVEMPGLDGYGVIEKLRATPLTETIPFIFITGKSERQDIRRGMELGADDYLTKPVSASELLGAIETRISRMTVWKKKLQAVTETLQKNMSTVLPHELRTPLTGVIGASSLLMNTEFKLSDDQVRAMAAMIHASGLRLNRLVQKFLLFNELEENTGSPRAIREYRSTRLSLGRNLFPGARDIVSMAAVSLAEEAKRTQDLELQVDQATLEIFTEDLTRVVEELVDNAFKFSRAGTPVLVKGGVSGTGYALSITDHGRGMPPAMIAGISAFVQFERDKKEQQGMGLGLAIVKRVLEIYRAEMTIESVPDTSTTVTAVLPLAPVENGEPRYSPGLE